jgi:hypothetical protein
VANGADDMGFFLDMIDIYVPATVISCAWLAIVYLLFFRRA